MDASLCVIAVGVARNVGLENAVGDFVAFVDSDDRVDKRYLEILHQNLEKNQADISICGWGREAVQNINESEQIEIWNCEEAFVNFLKRQKYTGGVWGKIYPRRIIKDIKFPVGIRMGEDQIFFVQVLMNADHIVYQNIPLYIYTDRGDSAVNSRTIRDIEEDLQRAEWYENTLSSKLPELKDLFENAAMDILVNTVVQDIKFNAEETNSIIKEIFPRIKNYEDKKFRRNSNLKKYVRYFVIKHCYGGARIAYKIKNKLMA